MTVENRPGAEHHPEAHRPTFASLTVPRGISTNVARMGDLNWRAIGAQPTHDSFVRKHRRASGARTSPQLAHPILQFRLEPDGSAQPSAPLPHTSRGGSSGASPLVRELRRTSTRFERRSRRTTSLIPATWRRSRNSSGTAHQRDGDLPPQVRQGEGDGASALALLGRRCQERRRLCDRIFASAAQVRWSGGGRIRTSVG
jgi:hypothetical protein